MYNRYRKKPVVIDALQFWGNWAPVPKWLDEISGGRFLVPVGTKPPITLDPESNVLLIDTLEGTMRCEPGDWLIRGVKGEFYPCKPDVFDATYEVMA